MLCDHEDKVISVLVCTARLEGFLVLLRLLSWVIRIEIATPQIILINGPNLKKRLWSDNNVMWLALSYMIMLP